MTEVPACLRIFTHLASSWGIGLYRVQGCGHVWVKKGQGYSSRALQGSGFGLEMGLYRAQGFGYFRCLGKAKDAQNLKCPHN